MAVTVPPKDLTFDFEQIDSESDRDCPNERPHTKDPTESVKEQKEMELGGDREHNRPRHKHRRNNSMSGKDLGMEWIRSKWGPRKGQSTHFDSGCRK